MERLRRHFGLLGIAAVVVLSGCSGEQPAAGDVTWYLPEDLSAMTLAQEGEPPLWPEEITVSHWSRGRSWVVVVSHPFEADSFPFPPLGDFMRAAAGTDSSGGGGPEGVEVTVYTSPDLDEVTRRAIEMSFSEEPHPDQLDPPIQYLENDDGGFDEDLQEHIQSFLLAGRGEISFGTPGAVVASFPDLGFGLTHVSAPIPADLLPIGEHSRETRGEVELVTTEFGSLIATAGGFVAVLNGGPADVPELVPTDDLTWGSAAWPTMNQFLRLGDLESDATVDGGCGEVIVLGGGCHTDLTPATGPPAVASGAVITAVEGGWLVSFDSVVVKVAAGAEHSGRVGIFRQNTLLLEVSTDDPDQTVEVVIASGRDALRLAAILDPEFEPAG